MNRLVPSLSRAATFAALTLALVAAGCSASGVGPVEDDGGGGSPTTTTTVGGMGGDGGGSTGPCSQNCAAVDTPMCLKSVCNEGQYPGTVGECVVVDDDDGTECDDGLFCTTGDACQAGSCVGGPQNTCGMEASDCEEVVCNESSKACTTQNANQGMACTPDDLCQVAGTCNNGVCTGQPKDCFFAPITDCEVATCNPATGVCEGQADPSKDGQSCVLGGDLCMVDKVCDNGQCIGGNAKDCSHLDIGCENGVCNQSNGQCEPMQVPAGSQCNTATDQCNVGICDAQLNCIANPVNDGTTCDDFNTCTTGDICTAGVCGGSIDPNCTTYFEGNFESGCPAPGWTLTGDWQCGAPSSVGPQAPYDGVNLIGTVLNGSYNHNQTYEANYAQTPLIGLGTAYNPVLSFYHWVHTEGSSFDGYNVKISTDGGNSFTTLTNVEPNYGLTVASQPAFGGNLGGWHLVTADLSAYVGQQIILRFSMRTDGSVAHPGVYIDGISVDEQPPAPIVITTQSLPEALESVPYSALIEKQGGVATSNWSIVGGTNIGWLSIDPNTGELFGTPALADVGPVSVTVHVEEPNDPNNFDEATFTFNVQQTVWAETFEGACASNGWTFGGDWQCGTPTSGPGSAYGGTQLIATQLGGTYNNNQAWATTNATSPTINLTGATAPLLRFWVWYHTENCCDGFNVKVSTDGVTYAIAPNVAPAYNGTVDNQQCWRGDASALGWQEHVVDLSAFAGQQINLRFGFRSDISVVNPGVYIDNVAISD